MENSIDFVDVAHKIRDLAKLGKLLAAKNNWHKNYRNEIQLANNYVIRADLNSLYQDGTVGGPIEVGHAYTYSVVFDISRLSKLKQNAEKNTLIIHRHYKEDVTQVEYGYDSEDGKMNWELFQLEQKRVETIKDPNIWVSLNELLADLDRALAIAKERNKIDDAGVEMV